MSKIDNQNLRRHKVESKLGLIPITNFWQSNVDTSTNQFYIKHISHYAHPQIKPPNPKLKDQISSIQRKEINESKLSI